MIKRNILFLIILFLSVGSPQVTESLNSLDLKEYTFVNTFDGIKIYWKTKYNSYSKGFGVLYKFENTTSQCVTVKYRASFKCGSSPGADDTGAVFIQRYTMKEGELNDLYSYSYPCPSGVSPTKIYFQAEVIPK